MQADWSKLEGKKVIIFGCHSNKSKVDIGIIVGCDPDIGICIANIGKVKPWFIVLGPTAPTVVKQNKDITWKTNRKLELEAIYKMLQSGYYSRFEDYNNEERIFGYRHSTSGHVPACPFSA